MLYHGFGDSGVKFPVIPRAGESADQYLPTRELIKRLHRRYGGKGMVTPCLGRLLRMGHE
jgi:hypothetical protein